MCDERRRKGELAAATEEGKEKRNGEGTNGYKMIDTADSNRVCGFLC